MLTQKQIDDARNQAGEWGGNGSAKYRTVNAALVGAEELLAMVQNEVGKPIDQVTLREAIEIDRAINKANLDARIEQIAIRGATQQQARYRVLLDTFESGKGGQTPAILGTAEEICGILGFLQPIPESYPEKRTGDE